VEVLVVVDTIGQGDCGGIGLLQGHKGKGYSKDRGAVLRVEKQL
jgi:hypothetical protein